MAHELARGVELFHLIIAAVRHVDKPAAVHGQSLGFIKAFGALALHAKGQQMFARR